MNIRINQPQGFSEEGRKTNQEDSLFPMLGSATANTRVWLVCDGMGGHENGEVASACVARTVGEALTARNVVTCQQAQQLFEQALDTAYQELDRLDHSDEKARKMGTTLTLLMLCSDGAFIAHIGDSRVYQMRKGTGVVFQTHDHSLLNDLLAAGELDEESAKTFPQKNVITRAVQPHQEYPAKASYRVITDVRKGDVFFLCCDGVVEKLDNKDLCDLLLTDQPLEKRVESLKNECHERDTRDNYSCYAIEVEAVEGAVRTIPQNNQMGETVVMPEKKKLNCKVWTLLFLFIFLVILLLGWKLKHDNPASELQEREHVEHVNGTINRNN